MEEKSNVKISSSCAVLVFLNTTAQFIYSINCNRLHKRFFFLERSLRYHILRRSTDNNHHQIFLLTRLPKCCGKMMSLEWCRCDKNRKFIDIFVRRKQKQTRFTLYLAEGIRYKLQGQKRSIFIIHQRGFQSSSLYNAKIAVTLNCSPRCVVISNFE